MSLHRPNRFGPRARRPLGVVGLEARDVPSVSTALVAGQLRIVGDAAADTITLDHAGQTTFVNGQPFLDGAITAGILVQGGPGADTVNLRASARPVRFEGQGDQNVLNVGRNGSVRGVRGDLFIGNSFLVTVTFNDQSDPVSRTVTMDAGTADDGLGTIVGLTPGKVTYVPGDIRGLTINAGPAGNRFDVLNARETNVQTMTLNTGTGNDVVTVHNLFSPLIVNGQAGRDAVTVGDSGHVSGITQELVITNARGKTRLTVDARAEVAGVDASLDVVDGSGVLHGLAPADIRFAATDVGRLTIFGGVGNDAWAVRATAAPTTLNAGAGRDAVTVGDPVRSADALAGPLTVNGDGGENLLTVIDGGSSPRAVRLGAAGGAGVITGLAPAPIRYAGGQFGEVKVRGNNAGNTFTVTDTVPGALTTLDSGQGADTLRVWRTAGPLTVNGQDGADVVGVGFNHSTRGVRGALAITNLGSRSAITLDNAADPGARAVLLDVAGTVGRLTGLAPAPITFVAADFQSLVVRGSAGGTAFTVADTASNGISPPTTLVGGGAADRFAVLGTHGPLAVDAGGGADRVTVGSAAGSLDPVAGLVTVAGRTGLDVLTVTDQGSSSPHAYDVTTTAVVRDGRAVVAFTGIESLTVQKAPGS